ncbi:MAG: DUF4919 domain-containing protein [Alistipes sp.]|nr:DUF4919 domain-containing protein [Alistipes sp.]
MKRILLLLALLLPLIGVGKTPVEQDILDRITDQRSPYYYLKLMMRYVNGALDLTDDDYHYLYYGYAYQEGYKPLEANPDMEEMLALMKGMNPDKVDHALLEQLLMRANAARMRDPFSPTILNVLTFVHQMLGNDGEAQRWSAHLNGVIRTILSSGDGLTIKSPRHILMFDHALDVMAAEGLAPGDARVVSRTVEFVPLVSAQVIEGKKRKGVYFNFERIYRNKPEGYTYKRERTWQFNNLKPREYK